MSLRSAAPVCEIIDQEIAARGRVTVAEFMELALYHPEHGYYASRAQRSGRDGDFYTSVDAGPLFGACIARYLSRLPDYRITHLPDAIDLVDAGAGNGRLARDILDALERDAPECYRFIRVHLVERSAAARERHREILGAHARKLVYSGETLPPVVRGAIVANELLDALPCHVVEMTDDGLREIYLAARDGEWTLAAAELSDPTLAEQLEESGAVLRRGWRAEVRPALRQWVADAARALAWGQLLIFDYGYDAPALYSAAHSSGTLARYIGHSVDARWMDAAGAADLTAHVDFTTVRRTAEREGLRLRRFTNQTRFLIDCGIADAVPVGASLHEIRRRLAANTLIAPEGLGGTIKVMILERTEA